MEFLSLKKIFVCFFKVPLIPFSPINLAFLSVDVFVHFFFCRKYIKKITEKNTKPYILSYRHCSVEINAKFCFHGCVSALLFLTTWLMSVSYRFCSWSTWTWRTAAVPQSRPLSSPTPALAVSLLHSLPRKDHSVPSSLCSSKNHTLLNGLFLEEKQVQRTDCIRKKTNYKHNIYFMTFQCYDQRYILISSFYNKDFYHFEASCLK